MTTTRDDQGRFSSINGAIRRAAGLSAPAPAPEPDEWEKGEQGRADPLVAAARRAGFRDPGDAALRISGAPANADDAVRELAARKPHLLDPDRSVNAMIRGAAGAQVEPVEPVNEGPMLTGGSWDGGARRTAPSGVVDMNSLIRAAAADKHRNVTEEAANQRITRGDFGD